MKRILKKVVGGLLLSTMLSVSASAGINPDKLGDELICVTKISKGTKIVSYTRPNVSALDESLRQLYGKRFDFELTGNSFNHTLFNEGREVIKGFYRATRATNGEACHELYKIVDRGDSYDGSKQQIVLFQAGFNRGFPVAE